MGGGVTKCPVLCCFSYCDLPDCERDGGPPSPTELMVRVLLIQQMFNLSDEQIEFQLLDCLSLQRFVGRRHSSQLPGRTTIWTSKERQIQASASASETVFDAVNRQLSKHGYMARGGQMIDASIVQTPSQSIKKEEKEIVVAKTMPADWSPAKRRQKDVEALWTKKHGKSYFGDMLSAYAYKRYKLIRKIKISTASEHDTTHFEAVINSANSRHLRRQGLRQRRTQSAPSRPRLAHAHPSARASGTSCCPKPRSDAIAASRRRAPTSGRSSPSRRRWAARRCARSAWRAPRCI